ncbi:MAG: hypothetical protein PHT07_07860 [Paludibacter sp.]|nr:hypothetical protein [Paludibacter sp.]
MKATTILPWRMSILILLILSSQSFSGFVHSQQTMPREINPVMKVNNLRKTTENPMRLDELNINIKVIGQPAVTTFYPFVHSYNTNPTTRPELLYI